MFSGGFSQGSSLPYRTRLSLSEKKALLPQTFSSVSGRSTRTTSGTYCGNTPANGPLSAAKKSALTRHRNAQSTRRARCTANDPFLSAESSARRVAIPDESASLFQDPKKPFPVTTAERLLTSTTIITKASLFLPQAFLRRSAPQHRVCR